MKIDKGKCVSCGREGIISVRGKRNEFPEIHKIMDKEFVLSNYGGGYYCCNIWCYLKARSVKGQTTLEGEINGS